MSNFHRYMYERVVPLAVALLMFSSCTSERPNPGSTPISQQAPAFNGFIYGGNIHRTGVYDGGSGPKFGDRLWKYKAEYGLDSQVIIAEGLAFMNVLNYGLHAIDIKTGEVRYTLDSYRHLPTVADGVLYYGGKDGEGLHAMDLATRKDNWVFKEGGGAGPSPVIHNGVVYFGGGTDSTPAGGGKGYLFAVDVKTGKEKWRFEGGSVSAPALGDGIIYFLGGETIWRADVGDFHGLLYAVDLETGKEVWHVEPHSAQDQSGSFGDPVYYDGLVYSATSYNAYLGPGHLYAFDAKTGKEIWNKTTDDELWDPSTPVAYNGSIYLAASAPRYPPGQQEESPLYVFDAKTGAAKWTFRARDYIGRPAISNGILYLTSSMDVGNRGALYSIDPETGKQLDKVEFEDALGSSPVISDGVIYVQGGSYEPVLEDVLIAISTLPSDGAHAATATPELAAVANGGIYKGNLQRTGHYGTSGVPTLAGERWAFKTGGSINSSPVEVDGVVYAGSDDGNLYALNADSGRLRWKYNAGGGISSSPTISDGRVIFGSDSGDIYGLDAVTGVELWKFKTGSGVVASPSVANGMVLCGSKDGYMYALNIAKGQKLWVHKAEGPISTSVALAGETAFYGDAEGYLYSVDAKTGSVRWKYEGESAVVSTPAVVGGVVYFGNQSGRLIALNAVNGTEKWGFKLGTGGDSSRSPSVTGSPAISGGSIYLGGEDGILYAVSATSGQQIWQFRTGGVIRSAPSVAGNLIYIGSEDGNLYAIDTATGKEQWRFAVGSMIATSPAIGNGAIYFGSENSSIHALQSSAMALQPTQTASPGEVSSISTAPELKRPTPSTRQQDVAMTQGGPQHTGVYLGAPLEKPKGTLWKFNAGQDVDAQPVVAGGVVYFSTGIGRLFAVDAQTGVEKWSVHTGSAEYLSPAVSGGIVYFGSDNGTFYAYDAQTGKEKWHSAGVSPDSAPTVSNGTVFFGSNDGHVYALDAGTGTQKWKFQTGDSVDSTPSVADGVVYVGGRSNTVYAIDAAIGKLLWKFHTSNFVHCSPAVADGIVYFGNWSGELYAVDAKTGKQVWQFDADGSVYEDIGVSDGMVYFGTNNATLYAVDSKTGAQKWSFSKEGESNYTGEFKAPAIIDGLVYATSNFGGIFALDAKTGQVKWQYEEGFMLTTPYVADGVLYIGDHGSPGHIYAIK